MSRLLFIVLFWLLSVANLTAQETGKKYALLIGVETYDPAVLRPLEFSEDDVLALGASLERLGFTTIAMTQQNTIPARRPSTAKKINDQLDGLLKLIKSDKDTLIVVLSGHGLQYKDDPLDSDQTKESFFCPEEANPKDRTTLVSITAFSQKLAKSGAGKKLLVVDACRNEVSAKGNKALEEELDPVGRRVRTEQAGMYALFSCAPKEKSWEHPELKHGVFISQMLLYLDGRADKSLYPREQISITQMAAFASRETTEFVYRRLNQEQTPELIGKGTDWSLGRIAEVLVKEFTNSIGMTLKLIPAGEFLMGSSDADVQAAVRADPTFKAEYAKDEQPQHRVRITRPFYMGIHEVTQAQYESVNGSNTSWFSPSGSGSAKVSGQDTQRFPVDTVSWFEAAEFCNKLSTRENRTPRYRFTNIERTDGKIKKASTEFVDGSGYRLPSEAEWEYACRAGTKSLFNFGNVLNGDQANVDGNYPFGTTTKGTDLQRTARVGSYGENAFGLFDLHGNVWEWCEDTFDENAYASRGATTSDPRVAAGSEYRVLRGGSWGDFPRSTRAAVRVRDSPVSRDFSAGFRVVSVGVGVRTP